MGANIGGEQMKAYRSEMGLTQGQLAEELTGALGTAYTTALVSYMERGAVLPPENVVRYVTSKIAEKPFRNGSNERKDNRWVITSDDVIKRLKSADCRTVYVMLMSASRAMPLTREDIAKALDCTDAHARTCIRQIRKAGARVCSSSRHYGYWLDEHGGGYEQMRSELIAKAVDIFETVRAMDSYTEGQLQWQGESAS